MVGAIVAVVAVLALSGCGTSRGETRAVHGPSLSSLPKATTFTTIRGLATDSSPATAGDGTLVHPRMLVPLSATPGGPPVAALPSTQLGGPTWVPVIASTPGWKKVLLPSRPNHSAGWIPDDGRMINAAHSPYVIKVDTSARRLTVLKSGQRLGSWTVATGTGHTPTPTGRTFLLASLAPPHPTYTPLILPVGAHSETLDSFGGGPGTVAFHGWPSGSVFGKAISHGCVRVPSAGLTQLSKIPLGTTVLISS